MFKSQNAGALGACLSLMLLSLALASQAEEVTSECAVFQPVGADAMVAVEANASTAFSYATWWGDNKSAVTVKALKSGETAAAEVFISSEDSYGDFTLPQTMGSGDYNLILTTSESLSYSRAITYTGSGATGGTSAETVFDPVPESGYIQLQTTDKISYSLDWDATQGDDVSVIATGYSWSESKGKTVEVFSSRTHGLFNVTNWNYASKSVEDLPRAHYKLTHNVFDGITPRSNPETCSVQLLPEPGAALLLLLLLPLLAGRK